MASSEIEKKGRFAFIIPVYNHGGSVGEVIEQALQLSLPLIVVDDGSDDSTEEILRSMSGFQSFCHERNLGKGAALQTGFAAAADIADWAITIDADGSHSITIRAKDPVGNVVSDTVEVILDRTDPMPDFQFPLDGAYINHTNLDLRWNGIERRGLEGIYLINGIVGTFLAHR